MHRAQEIEDEDQEAILIGAVMNEKLKYMYMYRALCRTTDIYDRTDCSWWLGSRD